MKTLPPPLLLLATCLSALPLVAWSFAPETVPPWGALATRTRILQWRGGSSHSRRSPDRHLPPLHLERDSGGSNNNDNDDNDGKININPLYAALATAETIFWYYLAPGIDPASRWFAPADAALITDKLLNPNLVLSPPPGSGIGPSSLLLNSFLILPTVWSLLLLQEDGSYTPGRKNQVLPPLPFCAAGFLVGGGALIPYMIVRRPRSKPGDVDPALFPAALRLFEGPLGPAALVGLAAVVLATFAYPFLWGGSEWGVEWAAFVDRVQGSQFTSLAVFDLTMISLTIFDPMADDARRRGLLAEDASTMDAVTRLAPYLIPLIGPVAWIYFRPKYDIGLHQGGSF